MTLFMIIELVGSVCFTTIIFKEPTDIESIKPILFKKILVDKKTTTFCKIVVINIIKLKVLFRFY